ncbi:MAG: class IV adenylate cyclase [Acidobacteria bacterium]|nr:class IV adenylate cyclase [Acidobacteriota bacterium]
MSIEIEKKYRLTGEERKRLLARLVETGAEHSASEFEENTIYTGGTLVPGRNVLRVRRVGGKAILTYKERYPSATAIRHQREEETVVENAEALAAILDALSFRPALVYEKRRETWSFRGAAVVVDELPFGLYAEIEGEEEAIKEAERILELEAVASEMATYPQLTRQHGERKGSTIEARFK